MFKLLKKASKKINVIKPKVSPPMPLLKREGAKVSSLPSFFSKPSLPPVVRGGIARFPTNKPVDAKAMLRIFRKRPISGI